MERMDQTMLTVTSTQSSIHHLAWRRLYLNKAKLKAVSRTSALLSGFAIISMVELAIQDVNPGLLIAYTINTTLLIAVHLLALMISTCILPNIESVSAMRSSIKDSPHESMHRHIQIAWMFSTVLGILLFFFEVALMCWVKLASLPGGRTAAIVSTCIILPAAVAFLAFACHFYRKLADHKYDRTNRNLEELENMHSGLQNV